uniref:Exc2 family lipoprotein n=1 Tax=Escherichia coli TaxID=562 RepID=UPI00201A8500
EKRVFLVILFTSFSGSLVSRIPGAVQSDVQQRIQQFHSQEFFNSLRGTTQFAGTDYRSKDLTPKKSRLLAETISAVYLDGYEGRQ